MRRCVDDLICLLWKRLVAVTPHVNTVPNGPTPIMSSGGADGAYRSVGGVKYAKVRSGCS